MGIRIPRPIGVVADEYVKLEYGMSYADAHRMRPTHSGTELEKNVGLSNPPDIPRSHKVKVGNTVYDGYREYDEPLDNRRDSMEYYEGVGYDGSYHTESSKKKAKVRVSTDSDLDVIAIEALVKKEQDRYAAIMGFDGAQGTNGGQGTQTKNFTYPDPVIPEIDLCRYMLDAVEMLDIDSITYNGAIPISSFNLQVSGDPAARVVKMIPEISSTMRDHFGKHFNLSNLTVVVKDSMFDEWRSVRYRYSFVVGYTHVHLREDDVCVGSFDVDLISVNVLDILELVARMIVTDIAKKICANIPPEKILGVKLYSANGGTRVLQDGDLNGKAGAFVDVNISHAPFLQRLRLKFKGILYSRRHLVQVGLQDTKSPVNSWSVTLGFINPGARDLYVAWFTAATCSPCYMEWFRLGISPKLVHKW